MFSPYDLSMILDPEKDSDATIRKWLMDVMIFVSPLMPRLESKEVIFNAILGGNPVVLFLREYTDQIMRLCEHLASKGVQTEYLIRLPLIVFRFRTEVEPEFARVHEANMEDLKELMPEYYANFK